MEVHTQGNAPLGFYRYREATKLKEAWAQYQSSVGSHLHIEWVGFEVKADEILNEIQRCAELKLSGEMIRLVNKWVDTLGEDLTTGQSPALRQMTIDLLKMTEDERLWDASQALFERVLSIQQAQFGMYSSEVVRFMDNGFFYLLMRDGLEQHRPVFERYRDELLKQTEEGLFVYDKAIVRTFRLRYATFLLYANDFGAAKALYTAILEQAQAEGEKDLVLMKLNVAWSLLGLLDEACIPLFEEVSATLKMSGWIKKWPECGRQLWFGIQTKDLSKVEIFYRQFRMDGSMQFWRLRVFRRWIDWAQAQIQT